jgi:hypothetical protein
VPDNKADAVPCERLQTFRQTSTPSKTLPGGQ